MRSGNSVDVIQRTWRTLGEVVANEVSLEQRWHLRVSRSRVVEDEEVCLEGRHEDGEGDDDEANHTRCPMIELLPLRIVHRNQDRRFL